MFRCCKSSPLVLRFVLLLCALGATATAPTAAKSPLESSTPEQSLVLTDIVLTFEGDWDAGEIAAIEHAASIWAGLIHSPLPIEIEVRWSSLYWPVPAYPYGEFTASTLTPIPDTAYPSVLYDIIVGYDSSVPYDFSLHFNSNFANWYTGLDGSPPTDAYDMVTVALKYMGLAFGIESDTHLCGPELAWGCWGDANWPYPRLYDTFVVNGAGQSLTNIALFPRYSPVLYSQLTGNDLFFAGPHSAVANGGARPKLYAPADWSGMNHPLLLDDTVFDGTAHALLTHTLAPGEAIHHPGAVALAMLKDMGWPLAADVPQPPDLMEFPVLLVGIDEILSPPLDLWAYTSDPDTPLSDLTFWIASTNELSTMVTIAENRFLHVNPAPGWSGEGGVTVAVRDPDGGEDMQLLTIIVTELEHIFLPATFTRTVPEH